MPRTSHQEATPTTGGSAHFERFEYQQLVTNLSNALSRGDWQKVKQLRHLPDWGVAIIEAMAKTDTRYFDHGYTSTIEPGFASLYAEA